MGLFDRLYDTDPSASPLGMLDPRAAPAWGDTVSQDPANFPTEYVDPRTLPPLEPAAPTGSHLGLSTASPAEQSPDWGKVIQGIAGAGLAGIAAGRGDLTFGMRMASQMQQMDLQKKRAAQQEEAMKMQKEQMLNAKFNHFFGFLKDFDVDEETTTKAGQAFIKANPDIQEFLQSAGVDPANLRLGKKGGSIKYKNYELTGDEGIMDPVRGQPLKGRYDLELQYKNGEFVPIGIGEIDEEATSELAKIDQKDYTPLLSNIVSENLRLE